MPNPHKLTITGAVKAEYDGSGAVTVEIPDSSEGINSKLDKNQGAENAGKALVIGEDGNVIPGEVQGGGDGIAIINTMSSVSPLAIPDSAERPIKGFNIIGNTVQNQEPPSSPDHPQEIKSVGKWNPETQKYEVEVTINSSDLFKVTEHTTGYYTVKDGKVQFNKSIGYSWAVVVNNLHKQTVILHITTATNTRYRMYCTDLEDTILYKYEDSSANANDNSHTFNMPDGAKKIYVSVLEINSAEQAEIALNLGNTALPFEPYKEQTLTLTSARPITKWDKLVEQDGQIGWLYQSAIKTFKDDVFKLYSDNEKAIQYQIPFEEITCSWEESVCYCNTFENVKGNLIYTQSAGKDFYMGCILKAMVFSAKTKQGIFASLEAFQQWIRNSDTYVLHKTNTTEFVPLQQSEQDAIRALKTYYPTTVVSVDGGEVYGGVEVTYTADTKNYIDNKIKQEKSIPTAIPEIS